jgi:acyl carrier protein
MHGPLVDIVNQVRAHKGMAPVTALKPSDRLRADLGFNSLDIAELTVRLEERFGVDVFADGIVHTVGEISARLPAART